MNPIAVVTGWARAFCRGASVMQVPAALGVMALAVTLGNGVAGAAERTLYTLLPASVLVEDCPPCGRPTIFEPMGGTFELRWVSENPLFTTYAVENVRFTAGLGGGSGQTYTVNGSGTLRVGGEVALRQEWILDLTIKNGFGSKRCFLTNADPALTWRWPLLASELVQTNGTLTQVYHLDFQAAPMAEVWYSTATGLTSARWSAPTNRVSGGDLLTSGGRVVRTSREFTGALGLMPSPEPPDLGLDAVDVLPGGDVVFSVDKDVFSERLGQLQHGDLLSSSGRLVRRNQALTAAFWQMPPVPDVGLDAVQMLDGETGEILFSVERGFFSESQGVTVKPGDLLSSRGRVVKRNAELLARFKPVDPSRDYGLDAIHVWPSGEVWFSVEAGFQGADGQVYGAGDLLSDEGRVIWRNLDLVGPFQPIEDLSDFGLDALFVVTTAGAMPPAPPVFTRIARTPALGGVLLEWSGPGRVWQVEGAPAVTGPWQAVSPVGLVQSYLDLAAPRAGGFYRLRQW